MPESRTLAAAIGVEGGDGPMDAVADQRSNAPTSAGQKGRVVDASSSSSSSSSSSRKQKCGIRLRSKRRWKPIPRRDHQDGGLHDLALPLGMSIAAVITQVLDGKNFSQERIPVDQLYKICTSAVNESVYNIYGDRFDYFLRNFEKSFGSTLRTMRLINETSICEQGKESAKETSNGQRNTTHGSFISDEAIEEFQEILPVDCVTNSQIILRQINQDPVHVSRSVASSVFNQSILNTIDKSVMEQTRSNDLKAVEIGLIMRKLQLKQSQLTLSGYATLLEKVKISMGISKACFKEEKLRNQMQDTRNIEVLRRCTDLLLCGVFIMLFSLGYGAFIYSYERITEETMSCSTIPEESKSWWVPKTVSSFTSGWLMLRCHVQVLTRMLSGFLMILFIAYTFLQRSSGPTMPVTFILLLLGVLCGISGKLCIDTLGGNGYTWALYWEANCLLHFIANIFPSALYYILYGPVIASHVARAFLLPYWLRRCIFYMMLLIVPSLAGLLPFASIHDWKEHVTGKITIWTLESREWE